MALGIMEQPEQRLTAMLVTHRKPWARVRSSRKWSKKCQHRRERRRASRDIECFSEYRRSFGWEW